MSITSVGASFGYVDPASLAGPTQSAAVPDDADDAPSPSGGTTSDGNASNSAPAPAAPQVSSDGGPKFSPATGAALVQVQEKANAA